MMKLTYAGPIKEVQEQMSEKDFRAICRKRLNFNYAIQGTLR